MTTFIDAIQALVSAGCLSETDRDQALTALTSTRTEFTYPDWAQALADAVLIQASQVDTVAAFMQQAANKQEGSESEADLDHSLENADIL